MKKILILASVLFYSTLSSHPKKLIRISGPNIDLQSINHSFAGSIKNRIVSGYKKAGQFESEISILDGDRKTTSVFRREASLVLTGYLTLSQDGVIKKHKIEFLDLKREEDRFIFRFDGKTYNIYVTADDFRGGHYINPTYSMEFGDETVSFKLEGGQACYGYSIHLISMIIPTYIF